ncbi:MAG: MBL fold metallo-hydrolase [Brachymonas sp.]
MPRSSQLLHPPLSTVTPRLAATVLLFRDGPEGPEVLMTRRSGQAGFAASLYVFPGGAVESADEAASEAPDGARFRDDQQGEARVWALAALRESYEEVGVLLAHRADGSPATQADVTALEAAIGRRSDAATFHAACVSLGLHPAADAVRVLARWLAPLDLPKRFDTPFLVARMPRDQTPHADAHEQVDIRWVRPAEAVALHAQGQFPMMFPTVRTLERLAAQPSVEAVLDACAAGHPLWQYCPRGALDAAGHEVRLVNEDLAYGELGLVTPYGQVAHSIVWQHEHPVPLLRNVLRLTAPNAGVMTGPGTNTYLVGTAASGFAVIDPGPADGEHLGRILAATGGDVRFIVCTHSHPDHSPGAFVLQTLSAARAGAHHRPPVLGLHHGPHARLDSHFVPDEELADGAALVLYEPDGTTHTLTALHTPGHTANHVCLALEEDGLLFSGDHILNGSTTIVDPPDGAMGDYLASLERLDAACVRHGLEFILPAHGYAMQHARAVIAGLRAHRLAREARVLAAMQGSPSGSLDDWVAHAYSDTPATLWPLARRSLLAHVEHLRMTGRAPSA